MAIRIFARSNYQLILATKRCSPHLAKTLYRNYLLRAKTHYVEWRHNDLSPTNGRFCKVKINL